MDREHFDVIARIIAMQGSRRSAIAVLVGSVFLHNIPLAVLAKHKRKRRRKQKRKRRCFPGSSCPLGPGSDNTGCDFAGSTAFENASLLGATLTRANLTGVNAQGADLRGADLAGACLVEVNLLEAKIDGTANLHGAIICNTLMPDGSLETSGCDWATRCCPTCPGGDCADAGVCTPVGNVCSVPFGNPCCPHSDCLRFAPSKFEFLTFCMTGHCANDQACAANFPNQDLTCETAGLFDCPPLVDQCCKPKLCVHPQDCPHSGVCCNTIPEITPIGRCCAPGMRCTVVGCL